MAIEKSTLLFGNKIYNHVTKEIGIIINTWENSFYKSYDEIERIPYATCVDINGKKYNTALDDIQPIEDLDDEELEELGIKL